MVPRPTQKNDTRQNPCLEACDAKGGTQKENEVSREEENKKQKATRQAQVLMFYIFFS